MLPSQLLDYALYLASFLPNLFLLGSIISHFALHGDLGRESLSGGCVLGFWIKATWGLLLHCVEWRRTRASPGGSLRWTG